MCMCIYTYNNVHTLPFTTRTVNQESEKWMRSEWRVFQARIWIFGPGAACASRRPELRNCLAYERLAAWKQAKQAKQALLSQFWQCTSTLCSWKFSDVSCILLFILVFRVLLKSLESQFGRGSNIPRGLPAGHRLRTGPLPSEPGRAKAAATPEGYRRFTGMRSVDLWISCDCTFALSNWLQLFWLWCACVPVCLGITAMASIVAQCRILEHVGHCRVSGMAEFAWPTFLRLLAQALRSEARHGDDFLGEKGLV